MESVLEDTLRLNKNLSMQVIELKKEVRRLSGQDYMRTPSHESGFGMVSPQHKNHT